MKKATESQLALARRFVDTLCEKDSGLALYTKGYACYGGNRLYPCDWETSRDCMIRLFEKKDDPQYANTLGYIYYYGRTGKTDYEKAFKYFVKGALDGHLRSLYKVGDFYKNGFYVDKDPKEAFAIYGHCTEMMTDEAVPLVGADVYMKMGDCLFEGIGVEKDLLAAQRFMNMAENLFYRRLMEGDFYQKKNLEHVIDTEAKIRKKIAEELLPDLSWAGYNE